MLKFPLAGAAAVAAISWISPFTQPLIGSPSVSAAQQQQQQQRPDAAAVDAAGVRALLEAGRFIEAEKAASALVDAVEKALGPEASETGDALELLLETRRGLRKSTAPGMVTLAERVVKIREATRGPDDASTATALIMLGRLKASNRDYDGGRAAVERALAIRERAFGSEHLEVANALNALAAVNRLGRQNAQAAAFAGRALALGRRLEAPAGLETMTALNTLAILESRTVEPERTVRMLEEAVAIEERLRPRDHPLSAAATLQLATAYREVGDLQAARTFQERGIAILEATNFQSYQVAFDMIELATINDAIGDYSAALSVAERAVALSERVTSPTSTLTAAALGILATMHSRLGDHGAAASTRERVVKLWGAQSPESLHVATALTALAESYWALGRMDEAFDAVERALAMKALANEPMMLTRTLQGHARLLLARGRTAEARAALERAVALGRTENKSLTRIELGMSLSDLATLEREDGHPDRALLYARESLQWLEKALGVDNVRTAARRSALSAILAETGAYDEARKELVSGERASLDHLRIIARTLTDRRALDFAAERPSGRNLAVTLATHPKIAAPGDTDMAWRIVVQGRNVVVDEMAARQQTVIAEAENTAVRDQWIALNRARARLANLVIGGPQGLTPEAYQALVERTRAAHDRAERDLAEASAAFRQEQSRARADVRDVLAALPKQTALISYVRYFPERLPGSPRPQSAKNRPARPPTATRASAAAGAGDAISSGSASARANHGASLPVGAGASTPASAGIAMSRGSASARANHGASLPVGAGASTGASAGIAMPSGSAAARANDGATLPVATRASTGASAGIAMSSGSAAARANDGATLPVAARASTAASAGIAMPSGSAAARANDGATIPVGVASTATTASMPAAYAAFIGRPGGLPPRVVPLGSADAIEAAVARWRAAIQTELTSGGLAAHRNETAYREAGEALRRLIWDPVQPFVRQTTSAFIVPDGAINLVDFSTLPIDRVTPAAAAGASGPKSNAKAGSAPRAGYLIDEPIALHYILAERDLVQPPPEPQGRSLLALGAPDFDKVDRAAAAALMSSPAIVGRASIPGAGATGGLATRGSEAAPTPTPAPAPAPTRGACEALSTRMFDPLPGTRQEMQQIAELWRQGTTGLPRPAPPTDSVIAGTSELIAPGAAAASAASTDDDVMLLGDDRASETAFKMLARGRRVLHLATHGFFLDRACDASPSGTTAAASNGSASGAAAPNASASNPSASNPSASTPSTSTPSAPNPTASTPAAPEAVSNPAAASTPAARGVAAAVGARVLEQSPLLRSGLVLAGANRRGEMSSDEDDGILTAEEIAGLDLSAAQWAVLSACDTGRGDLQAGEGVVGLRRAFQVAGARTVILSLWPVLDTVAADWMAELYRGKFVRGETTATSVRAASRSLLAARRAAGQSTHPLYWSGFIATGDWR